eukprot:GHVU01206385.1.p1 GENE.GHVU01206385.1~~GHVU01206385.1.p1  ORF type:complete len:357 (+),score=62.37 GHVU01206385.1:28-1071(+)
MGIDFPIADYSANHPRSISARKSLTGTPERKDLAEDTERKSLTDETERKDLAAAADAEAEAERKNLHDDDNAERKSLTDEDEAGPTNLLEETTDREAAGPTPDDGPSATLNNIVEVAPSEASDHKDEEITGEHPSGRQGTDMILNMNPVFIYDVRNYVDCQQILNDPELQLILQSVESTRALDCVEWNDVTTSMDPEVEGAGEIGEIGEIDPEKPFVFFAIWKQLRKHFRMTIDLRQVNTWLYEPTFAMPNLEEELEYLEGSDFFAQLDLVDGYTQCALHRSSREIFSAVTTFGVFSPKRVPQGASCSVAYFQAAMEEVFRPLIRKGLSFTSTTSFFTRKPFLYFYK